ncbi:3-hydroxyisobutyrate dehydrogenase [Asanoa ishikariensis]|uniref:3-hydroxyisobutyrate dehydrogenase/2-hydroxy-3-oxopropionate reductase n=1 Tax=Asanoa ishikariensis TaxID=137265 RepID=A0A1H3TNM9_9ACTN|nr:NAD(P)-dependent oxidoreductase [Asanoa ishikariensis]GIF62072.1 3-hydroxyisobutyrate dehydrogenase [Asanoa ishikariensis]SDZ51844.1 3-hydroxyisobutyrate dehydrogenase/2-hydroxy-3-oxopropionate reductase [Asanoa ishikariensis]
MTAAPVAVIGTGRMGAAMVGRLAGAGHPVTVYNRTPSRAAGLPAVVAPTPAEAVAGAAFVVVSLADDDAVRAVYADLVGGLTPDAIVLETSTIHPDTVRELAAAVGDGRLLDSPVSGSVALVSQGALTALVGGSAEALEQARPVLSTFASRVLHLGPQGSGATMKLVVNSVIHGLNQAVAEALVLAERAGIDRTAAYDVLAASAVAAPFVAYKRDAYVNPDAAGVAFALDLVAKDLRLIDALATSVGARMPQLAANAAVVADAVDGGYGAQDMSALAALLRSGVTD